MPENLEIKVRVENLARLESVAKHLGPCIFNGIQRDTYFRISKGRLKLREADDSAELIFYTRPDTKGARWSCYITTRVNNPREVRLMLSELFGIKQVVKKRRKVFIYRNARIHLDRVEGLGTFLEIEVTKARSNGQARELLGSILEKMQITRKTLIGKSYSDLLAGT